MYWSLGGFFLLFDLPTAAITSTTLSLPCLVGAGTVTAQLDVEVHSTAVAAFLPNLNAVPDPSAKPVPVIVILFPPASEPTLELNFVIVGGVLGLVALAAIAVILGTALTTLIPIHLFQVVVGTLLLLFGLRWLRKALLRFAGIIALHDEELIYQREVAVLRAQGLAKAGIDWVGVTVTCKAVLLEGLEVVFVILTLGAHSTAAFHAAVPANLDPNYVASGGRGDFQDSRNFTASKTGYYAPVLTTESGESFVIGASANSDARDHIRVYGQSTFGFEDLKASQGSDWDYNDLVMKITSHS